MNWYCLHIKGRQEFNAEQHLMAQGFDVYLPQTLISKKKQRGNVNKILQSEPLFPNYLFINLIKGVHDFGAVKNTRGVHDFAMRSLVPVPDYIIEELKSRESNGLHNLSDNEYQQGERVRITKGAFKFYEAIIAEKRDQRIWIILDMLGSQKIAINPQDIEAAG